MRLRTLGGLSLEGTTFTRPRPLLLLAYLALEGGTDHDIRMFRIDRFEGVTA